MNFSEDIKPISYLKSHTTEIVKSFDEQLQGPMIITQNGEAKMVVLGIADYQRILAEKQSSQEKIAFLQLMRLGDIELSKGEFISEDDFLVKLKPGP